ncbi:hypothetical protein BaOVIS_025730 [Babesia ovis]|uniref:Uncharacterized protein n=1 Tax=Babesia ovis TaxID=5869 RepID=A0A9W5WVS4_BABOV|nr:hypothetical protein BaOVIS_025730 [Babesia ovis]
MDTSYLWSDRLSTIRSIVPCNISTDDDIRDYIKVLTGPGDHLQRILEQNKDAASVILDIVHLLEFEKDDHEASNIDDETPHHGCGIQRGMQNNTLLYTVVSIALQQVNSIAMQLINKLYLRGFAKDIVQSLILYLSKTVSNSRVIDFSSIPPGRLQDSNATMRICSHAIRAMSSRMDIHHGTDGPTLCFRSFNDYNVAIVIVTLLLESVVLVTESNHEQLIHLFHPRSAALIPLQMQFFVIDTIKHLLEPSNDRSATNDRCINQEPLLDTAKKLLLRLSMLWSEKDIGATGIAMETVALAGCITKLMDMLYNIESELKSTGFDQLEVYLTQGINHKLGSIDRITTTAAIYVASSLSKWVQQREQLLSRQIDHSISSDDVGDLDEHPLIYLKLSRYAVIVNPEGEINLDGNTVDATLGNNQYAADIHAECDNTFINPVPLSTSPYKNGHLELFATNQSMGDNQQTDVEKLVNDIFADVPVVEFHIPPTAAINPWTEPPQHIQQCLERLRGAPVAADVELGKLLNKPLNKPRDMPNDAVRNMIAQTLVYLPVVINRNEPILDKFAVPLCQFLVKMDHLELYEEPIMSIASKMAIHDGISHQDGLKFWHDIIGASDDSETTNVQAHIAYAVQCLATKRPQKLLEYFCESLPDTEYSLYQKLIMLTAMQTTVYSLSKIPSSEFGNQLISQFSRLSSIMGRDKIAKMDCSNSTSSTKHKPLAAQPPCHKISAAPEITLRSGTNFLITPIEERRRSHSPMDNQLISSKRMLSKNTVMIQEVSNDQPLISGIIPPCKNNPIRTLDSSLRRPVDTVVPPNSQNEFAPMANLAIDWITAAVHKWLSMESGQRKPGITQLLTLCMLDTLCLLIQCSGGRLSPDILQRCKDIAIESYKAVPTPDMSEMLLRLTGVLDTCALGNIPVVTEIPDWTVTSTSSALRKL